MALSISNQPEVRYGRFAGEQMSWPEDARSIGLENMLGTEIWFLQQDFKLGRYTVGPYRIARKGSIVVGVIHINDGASYEFRAIHRHHVSGSNFKSEISWITKLETWDERAKQ